MPTASAPRAEDGLRARVNMTGQCSAKEKNLSPAVTIRAIGARTGQKPADQPNASCGGGT